MSEARRIGRSRLIRLLPPIATAAVAVIYLVANERLPAVLIGDPVGPQAFPRLVGIALLLASATWLAEMLRQAEPIGGDSETPVAPRDRVVAIVGVAAWIGVYCLLFEAIGFLLSTIVFLLPLMAYMNRGKWIANLAATIITVGSIYFLFAYLGIVLPEPDLLLR
jgi:putative tricarboxylic transport membrane protein